MGKTEKKWGIIPVYIAEICKIIESSDLRKLDIAVSSILSNIYKFNKKNCFSILQKFERNIFSLQPSSEHAPILAVMVFYHYKIDSVLAENYMYKLEQLPNENRILHPYIEKLMEFSR